jgi:hypothetical protein
MAAQAWLVKMISNFKPALRTMEKSGPGVRCLRLAAVNTFGAFALTVDWILGYAAGRHY